MNLFKNRLFLFLMLFSFIEFPSYIIGPFISNILHIYRLLIVFLVAFIYLKKGCSKLFITLTIFEGLYVLSSLLSKPYCSPKTAILYMISILGITMITELGLKTSKDKFLQVTAYYLCFLILINSLTFLHFYPYGMNNGVFADVGGDINFYFLGHDNGSIFYCIPALIYLLIYNLNKYNKINLVTIIFIIFVTYSYLYIKSINALTVLLILLIFLLCYKNTNFQKLLNFKFLLIITGIIFYLVVFYNHEHPIFLNILNLIGKDSTFNGRSFIWNRAIEYIKLKPLIGHGLQYDIIVISHLGVNKTHNIFLQILYNTGICGLSVFIYLLYSINQKLKQSVKNIKIKKTIILGIFLFLFAGLFDYYNYSYFAFSLFALGFNIGGFNDAN